MNQKYLIKIIIFCISLILIVGITIQNISKWHANLLFSIQFTVILQKYFNNNKYFNYLNYFFSYILFFLLFGIAFIIFYLEKKKIKGFKLLFTLSIGLFFQGFLKMLYLEPRPLFSSIEINVIDGVDCNYGNPSGHSYLSTLLLFSFFLYYKFEKNYKSIWFFIILLLIDLSIMFSRLYYGMHTILQVTWGFLYGVFFTILLKLTKNYWSKRLLKPIIENKKSIKKEFIVINIFWIILNVLTITVFFINIKFSEKRILNKNNFIIIGECLNEFENNRKHTFSYKHLREIMIFNIFYGLIFGIYFYKGEYTNEKDVPFSKKSKIYSLFRFLLFISPFSLVAIYKLSFDNEILEIIKLFLSSFISGFLIGFVIPNIQRKLGLINKNQITDESTEFVK